MLLESKAFHMVTRSVQSHTLVGSATQEDKNPTLLLSNDGNKMVTKYNMTQVQSVCSGLNQHWSMASHERTESRIWAW